jgi:membrane protease YdiL (CAAX protease family)
VSHRPNAVGGVLLAVFSLGWIATLGVLAVLTVGLLLVDAAVQTGGDPAAFAGYAATLANDPTAAMRGWVLAVTMSVQLPAMLALVPVTWGFVGAVWRGAGPRGPWRAVLGTAPAPAAALVLAVLAGLTVGLLPGWLAAVAREAFPSLAGGTLDLIERAFREGPLVWRLLLALDVAILAPVVEELVFRGFVWDALRRSAPLWLVWLLSSALFCAYHMDPLQSAAIVPTALMLGWIRWTTGSVVPAILAHAVNNLLAVSLTWIGAGGGPEVSPSPGLAVVGAGVTLGVFGGFAALRLRRSATFDDAPLVVGR